MNISKYSMYVMPHGVSLLHEVLRNIYTLAVKIVSIKYIVLVDSFLFFFCGFLLAHSLGIWYIWTTMDYVCKTHT